MIEDIKSSVTGIDIEKAIELKDSYDKLNARFRYLQTPTPVNQEFQELYLGGKSKPKENSEKQQTTDKIKETGKKFADVAVAKFQDPKEAKNQ